MAELSVLNLGAGNGEGFISQQIQDLPIHLLTNVELHPDALFQLSHHFHFANSVDYINADMLEYVRVLPDKSYDVCLMIDSLEHLTRVQAVELIGHLSRVVRHRTLVWLPFGDTPQGEYGGNPHQEHKSTWMPDDFLLLGASVDVCWRHWHIAGAPYAGWVTFNYQPEALPT